MGKARIEIPDKLHPVLAPTRGTYRYRALHGGRGSGKSRSVATIVAIWGYAEKLRILCTREFQVSIPESFHAELRSAISQYPWLEQHYDIGRDYIRGRNGTEFLFRGLRRNSQAIKSLADIDVTVVEEAEDVPEQSWLDLEATVFRRPRAEMIVIWNPRLDGSPVDKRFIKSPPQDAIARQVNWQDNPFFPSAMEKLRQREQERLDPATYAHVWEGEYLENSDAQVLSGKVRVAEFEPGQKWDGPYYGLDYGFAQDPTAAVECWIYGDRLYVYREVGGVGVELDDTTRMVKEAMPGIERHVIRADNARPESTSYLKRHGLPRVESAPKWQGSVEDGIQFLRSFKEIVIHPDCKQTIRESRLYSHKVDRHTGEIRPDIEDANNHYIDAIRYALAPIIRRGAKISLSEWL